MKIAKTLAVLLLCLPLLTANAKHEKNIHGNSNFTFLISASFLVGGVISKMAPQKYTNKEVLLASILPAIGFAALGGTMRKLENEYRVSSMQSKKFFNKLDREVTSSTALGTPLKGKEVTQFVKAFDCSNCQNEMEKLQKVKAIIKDVKKIANKNDRSLEVISHNANEIMSNHSADGNMQFIKVLLVTRLASLL